METWRDKLARSNKLFEDVKALLSNPEATAEQKSHIQQMVEDAQKLKAEALQLKSIEEAQAELKDLNVAQRPDQQAAPETKDADKPAEFKGWGEYLWSIWMLRAHQRQDSRLTWFEEEEPEGHEQKQMTGAVGARGGFLIPGQFIPTMQAVQQDDSIVRRFATVIRMASRQVSLPVLDQTGATPGQPHWFGGMKFYWTEEGAEKEDTEVAFRRVNLVAKKLTGLTYASDELLDDMAISLGDFLSGPLGFAGGIVWMEDFSFLRGVGGGQPRGVINAPCTIPVARQAAGQVNYVDCINMLSNMLPSARGRWVVSQNAMPNLIQMSGPAGNPSYVWQPSARDGIPGYLFGMPVHWSEKLPQMGARGDILLADFRYYIIGDRQSTTIEASQFPRWVYDQTTWRVVHRVDGQPWLSAPLTYQDGVTQVSPFVVLTGTAS